MKQLRTLNIVVAFTLVWIISTPQFGWCERGRSGQVVFETPEEALKELVEAAKREDSERLIELFGKPYEKIFITGDKAGDALALRRLSNRFEQRAELFAVQSENYSNEQWYLIRYGIEGWNMHVPLVNRGQGWSYASEYASNTDLRIRKSINEVAVVDTLLALVKAQEEYKSADRNGDGVLEYAQRFISTPGKRDGLYWPDSAGDSSSPLDGIIARALEDGYKLTGKNSPYGGYIYRILTSQDGRTRGGKKSYLKDGHMVDGFAIVAYPVEWNSSGDSTFLVAKDGQVWKQNLGARTERIASDMTAMDLDFQWVKADPHLGGKNSRSNWN